jgi:hypothetical protein
MKPTNILIMIGGAILVAGLAVWIWPMSSSIGVRDSELLKGHIEKLLPQGAMLRDFVAIPSTNKALVIYIQDPVIEPEDDPDVYLYTCPGQVHGQPITGEYHLALFMNERFVNDVIIPDDESGLSTRRQGIVFRQVKGLLHRYDDHHQPLDEDEADQLVEVKLLNLKDLNGDGLPHEFQLKMYLAACGHVQVLTAGYSARQEKAMAYPIVEQGNQDPYYWHDNFYPDKNGTVHWRFLCGDHANNIDARKTFEFDQDREAYVLTSHSETPCGQ